MNFSEIYSDQLPVLLNAQKQLKRKIYEKEVEILKSKEFEPKIIEWAEDCLDIVLLYISHVKNWQKDEYKHTLQVGLDESDYHPIFWDTDYIQSMFPENDRFEFLSKTQSDTYPWDTCPLSIPIGSQCEETHFIPLISEDTDEGDNYYYSISYNINIDYIFFAEILERILIEHRDEIYHGYYERNMPDYSVVGIRS